MIRKCTASDFERIYEIVNNGAEVYKGVIPSEYWTEPYMSREELRRDHKLSYWENILGVQHTLRSENGAKNLQKQIRELL